MRHVRLESEAEGLRLLLGMQSVLPIFGCLISRQCDRLNKTMDWIEQSDARFARAAFPAPKAVKKEAVLRLLVPDTEKDEPWTDDLVDTGTCRHTTWVVKPNIHGFSETRCVWCGTEK